MKTFLNYSLVELQEARGQTNHKKQITGHPHQETIGIRSKNRSLVAVSIKPRPLNAGIIIINLYATSQPAIFIKKKNK